MSYEERIIKLGLWTLEERRNRADLIEVFKLINGHTSVMSNIFFEMDTSNRTRGHSQKLIKHKFNSNIRQHFFSDRVVNKWNALDEETVSVNSVNAFKKRLEELYRTKRSLFLD